MKIISDISTEDYKTQSFINNANILKKFWAERNRNLIPAKEKGTGLKKQKVLFFYNVFSYINEREYTFDKLAAFEDGPVYVDIYSFVKHQDSFIEQLHIKEQCSTNQEEFDAAKTMVESLSDTTLSKLTHAFDMWDVAYHSSVNDAITEKFISDKDIKNIKSLYKHFKYISENFTLYKNNRGVIAVETANYYPIFMNYNNEVNNIADDNDVLLFTINEGVLHIG